jgi:hypothetical protein
MIFLQVVLAHGPNLKHFFSRLLSEVIKVSVQKWSAAGAAVIEVGFAGGGAGGGVGAGVGAGVGGGVDGGGGVGGGGVGGGDGGGGVGVGGSEVDGAGLEDDEEDDEDVTVSDFDEALSSLMGFGSAASVGARVRGVVTLT